MLFPTLDRFERTMLHLFLSHLLLVYCMQLASCISVGNYVEALSLVNLMWHATLPALCFSLPHDCNLHCMMSFHVNLERHYRRVSTPISLPVRNRLSQS